MASGRAGKGVALSYDGVDIPFDDDRLISLTAMWRAAGSPESKRPNDWTLTEQGAAFIDSVAKNLNAARNGIWKSRRGKHLGGVFAHWQIALAYGKYLSPEFHQAVNEAFKEWSEEAGVFADVTLAWAAPPAHNRHAPIAAAPVVWGVADGRRHEGSSMRAATRRMMMAAGLAMLAGLADRAEAGLIVDQQNTVGGVFLVETNTPILGQSFTPTLAAIDFATFSLSVDSAATYRADLLQGAGFGGTLLGSSASQALFVGNLAAVQPVEFTFAAPIPLVPLSPYTLRITRVSGTNFQLSGAGSSSNPYAGGIVYDGIGNPGSDLDLVFSEGINAPVAVPEPSTLAGAGTAALLSVGAWLKRRRATA